MPWSNERVLAAARAAGDTTDKALAARLGVSPVTAWRLRTGKCAPGVRTLAAIERAYGVTAAQVIGAAA
ncbi:helix-turn-helix transcriptional regulator [Streptomyces sp. NPDC047070]|uniref:helix-turn-helix domain-containing protein n=1 Tax=Streptomyces sp. NPDC047070 TaxID=3154923 RepID=UPI003453A896